MRQYGSTGKPAIYEFDHDVSIEIGGALDDIHNLWPQPLDQAKVKDTLENKLHTLVCNGSIPLATAQQAIVGDWTLAYTTYVGPLP
jgi:hypothetical protein